MTAIIRPIDTHVPFPLVSCDTKPAGHKIIVQLRTVRERTAGGIIVPDESRDMEGYRTTIGRVVAIGPAAFADRQTGEKWAHALCEVGNCVRIPEHGGARWKQKDITGQKDISFVLVDDTSIIGIVDEAAV